MKSERISLWDDSEYTYPMAGGFVPYVQGYLHEDKRIRPCMIVVPGGGYIGLSVAEAEIVAKAFFEKGYQSFVCVYTVNPLVSAPLRDLPLRDVSRAVRLLRKISQDKYIDSDRIYMCGFSAGAHLAGTLGVHWETVTDVREDLNGIPNRPNALILSYPLITMLQKTHSQSVRALLGENASLNEKAFYSLEKNVTPNTPPCFIWQTEDDEIVPVENSYLMAMACHRAKVKYAYHIFSAGRHGLSLANEIWEKGDFGEPYTLEQPRKIYQLAKKGEIILSEERMQFLKGVCYMGMKNPTQENAMQNQKNPEVQAWFGQACDWLEKIEAE